MLSETTCPYSSLEFLNLYCHGHVGDMQCSLMLAGSKNPFLSHTLILEKSSFKICFKILKLAEELSFFTSIKYKLFSAFLCVCYIMPSYID